MAGGGRDIRVASAPAAASPLPNKSFVCTEPGCTSAFVRSEHLSRHRLNHCPRKVYACTTCPKKFVRPDLYRRHKARHAKGMWYRNVGGVVGIVDGIVEVQHELEETQVETPEPSSVNDTVSPPRAQQLPPDVAENHGIHSANIQDHDQVNRTRLLETNDDVGADDLRYESDTIIPGLGFNYGSPPDGPETLFFDGSANVYDLPDSLAWYFENPQLDTLSDMDMPPPLPPYQAHFTSPGSADGLSTVSSLPSINSHTWPIVQTRLIESLCSLPPDIIQSCYFYPSNLQKCYELYFDKYDKHFPFLHRPTFLVTEAEPLLVAAIITLGSTMNDDDVIFNIGQRIHDSLRWIIFQTGKFEPPSPLWCLQALLLVQAQAKMFSTRKHHEMAHIFHGSILTMMKRGRAYSPAPEDSSSCTSTEYSWRNWAEQESSRRTAFFAFIMDAQHASIFGHTPVLPVNDVRLPLPCTDKMWECRTATRWESLSRRAPEPSQFLPTLKAVVARTLVPTTCSDYSRFIILHGLLSLTTHLHARETSTLGIGVGKIGPRDGPTPISQVEDWIEIISCAIGTWSFSLLSLEPSLCLEAARPLHRMAFITLHTNITDFQVLVTNPVLLENVLSKREFAKAEARVQSWAHKEGESKRAVMHSLLLVKETVFAGHRYHAREDNIAPRPWCLYHAILVLWAYGIMTEGPEDEHAPQMSAEEYVGRMLSSLQCGMPGKVAGASRTRGLICAMRDAFEGCRWALLEEAFQTLKRLVGTSATGVEL